MPLGWEEELQETANRTSNGLSNAYLRRPLLEFFENTRPQPPGGLDRDELERRAAQGNRSIVKPPSPFDSWFEVDVALELLRKDFTVLAQYEVAGKRIDLVVEGGEARLAIECDGDNWHGADRYEADMERQRQLERCGWEFFRVRESAFYSNKENALAGLWQALEERDIFPGSRSGNEPPEGDCEVEDFDETNGNGAEDDDSPYDEEDCPLDDLENGLRQSGRRAELHSLTSRVLKEVGVLTRGNPRVEFERRVLRSVDFLEKRKRIEKYKATIFRRTTWTWWLFSQRNRKTSSFRYGNSGISGKLCRFG